jgi:hypothetical protein
LRNLVVLSLDEWPKDSSCSLAYLASYFELQDSFSSFQVIAMTQQQYSPGDLVIFRKSKCTSSPGPRAVHVNPAPRGEAYAYEVDKFWVVVEARLGQTLLVRTRRGKEHVVRADDPQLRRPSFWERLRYAARFPRWRSAAVRNEEPAAGRNPATH